MPRKSVAITKTLQPYLCSHKKISFVYSKIKKNKHFFPSTVSTLN